MSQVSQVNTAPQQAPAPKRRWKELAAVFVGLGLAAVLGLGAWLIFGGGSDSDQTATTTPFGPEIVDEATLRAEVADVGHTVYWMPPKGRSMELTIVEDGTVHVRYLSSGSEQAEPGTTRTTVSSWPMADPLGRAQQSASSEGAMSVEAPGGGLYVAGSDSPYNAFVGEPNTTALGEVYDPKPGQAWRDVTNGKVTVLQP